MNAFMQYVLWNMIFVGGFVFATIYDIKSIVNLAEVIFTVFAGISVFVCLITGSKIFKDLGTKIKPFSLYNIIFEALFIYCAFKLNNHYVALMMFIEFSALSYIRLYLKSQKEQA